MDMIKLYINGSNFSSKISDSSIIVNILGLYSYPTGSGHTWVCDGYIQSFTTDCESGIGYGTLYFHMNWGWNGQHNGWYAYNAWPYYSFFPDMIYNIHP